MTTIFKYVIPRQVTVIEMPVGAKLLHVTNQHSHVTLWAEVDSDAKRGMEQRKFYTVVTGGEVPPLATYCDTVLLDGGMFVVHVYEAMSGLGVAMTQGGGE